MFNNVIAYWEALNQKDQRAITVLAIVLVPILIWYLLIFPVTEKRSELQDTLSEKKALNTWLIDVGPMAKAIARRSGTISIDASDQDLSSNIIRVAQKYQLELQKFELDNKNGLRVWFENIRFDHFVSFLNELSNTLGIMPQNLSIDRQKADGIVNVRGVLSSGS